MESAKRDVGNFTAEILWELLQTDTFATYDQLLRFSCERCMGYLIQFERVFNELEFDQVLRQDLQWVINDLNCMTDAERMRHLLSPVFRHWLWHFGNIKKWHHSDLSLGFVKRFFWNANLTKARLSDYSANIAAVNGIVTVNDCRQLYSVPLADSQEHVLRFDASIAAACTAQHLVSVLPGSHIAVCNQSPMFRITLNSDGAPERNSGYLMNQWEQADVHYSRQYGLDELTWCLQFLNRHWPAEAAAMNAGLHLIVPRLPPKNWDMNGFTISNFQGVCWLNLMDRVQVLEALVHEHNHIKLRYIESQIPILAGDQITARFNVGWRTDPRPLIGIYEGVFVHIHSLRALTLAMTSADLTHEECAKCKQRIEKLYQDVREGLAILQKHGEFTHIGRVYLDWAKAQISKL